MLFLYELALCCSVFEKMCHWCNGTCLQLLLKWNSLFWNVLICLLGLEFKQRVPGERWSTPPARCPTSRTLAWSNRLSTWLESSTASASRSAKHTGCQQQLVGFGMRSRSLTDLFFVCVSEIQLQVVDLRPLTHMFRKTFHFASNVHLGEMVVPHLAANFGPIYMCKLRRLA